MRKELSLPSKRWTTTHERKGISRSQARLLDAIDLTFQLASHGDESLAAEVMVDLSQQIDGHRRPWRTDGPGFKSMTQNTEFFSFAVDRLLSPEEHMQALGFPDEASLDYSCVSWPQLRSLSGDAMALLTVTCVTLSLLFALKEHAKI